jgi:two-component system CheB/CheR fusion protein
MPSLDAITVSTHLAMGKKRRSTGKAAIRDASPAASRESAPAESAPAGAAPAAAALPRVVDGAVPVVGMGASAGGLNAFKKFFSKMPAAGGLAFVLIPHLDPRHESLMVALLTKYTAMAVVEAGDGMGVEADHVYIIPPNKDLTIRDGVLHLSAPVEARRLDTSIDSFLRSLAEDRRERAIGIILSGTGAHGTLGLKAIKANDGMCMVQEPRTAEYPAMPQSAVAAGLADYVLPPEDMPAALTQYVQHFLRHGGEAGGEAGEGLQQSSDPFNRILSFLRAHIRFDFRCYRPQTLLRRIRRRMSLNHTQEMSEYLAYLRKVPGEVKKLAKDLLVSVTSYFRDPEAFRALEAQVLAPLVQAKGAGEPIRVWVPACATGEEPYSVLMSLSDQLSKAQKSCPLQVFASDVDEEALEFARHGVYPSSIAADLTPEQLARHFVRTEEGAYQVSEQQRKAVVFSFQNVLGDAPFSRLDLIVCRNLLIYLEAEIQKKVIALFHFALNEGGYLFLGPSESVGDQGDLFETVSKKWRIFRRSGATRPERVSFPIVPRDEPRAELRRLVAEPPVRAINFAEITRGLLLEQYAPAAVLINRRGEILYFFGPTSRYLDQPVGAPTRDLMLLARDGLRSKLRAMIHKASSDRRPVSTRATRVKGNVNYHAVRVNVRPVQEPRSADGLFLVTFSDEAEPAAPLESEEYDEPLVRQLELELKATREDLQSTIEELECSNEEMKTAHEEVMSSNEELQSANEELETAKEELQSLNEELTTVNNQLQEKLVDLESANNNMANLFQSADIATVFLDSQYCIKFFTPAAAKYLSLIPTDLHRPLRDVTPKFNDPQLLSDAAEVLHALAPREREVTTADGRWAIRRILPFRTSENRLDGVILTFLDITNLKQSEAELRRMSKVFMEAADPIFIENLDGVLIDMNMETERVYGWTRQELTGRSSMTLVAVERRPWKQQLLARCRDGEAIRNAESLHQSKRGEMLPVLITLSLLRGEAGQPFGIATTTKHISELKRSAAEQKVIQEGLEERETARTAELKEMNQKLAREVEERRGLERQVLEIAAAEQRRIGQDLHDEVGQQLTGLGLLAENLLEFFPNRSGPEAKTMARIVEGMKRTVRVVRELSQGLIPVEVDPEGLMAALQDLAARTSDLHGVNCTFTCAAPVPVADNSVATQLYCIGREAVANCVRHAHAKNIRIALQERGGQVILRIEDDGIGMPAPVAEDKGVGLRILRYRAALINAGVTIDTESAKGTVVTCALPGGSTGGHP